MEVKFKVFNVKVFDIYIVTNVFEKTGTNILHLTEDTWFLSGQNRLLCQQVIFFFIRHVSKLFVLYIEGVY